MLLKSLLGQSDILYAPSEGVEVASRQFAEGVVGQEGRFMAYEGAGRGI